VNSITKSNSFINHHINALNLEDITMDVGVEEEDESINSYESQFISISYAQCAYISFRLQLTTKENNNANLFPNRKPSYNLNIKSLCSKESDPKCRHTCNPPNRMTLVAKSKLGSSWLP